MRLWTDEEEVRAPHTFRMELDGNRELYVEGCRSILSYQPEIVRVELQKLIFSVSGSGLTIENMNGDSMRIRGWIVRIEFTN